MRSLNIALLTVVLGLGSARTAEQTRDGRPQATGQSVRLEDLSWTEAEPHLVGDAIVMLPLGAAAKEHGPHLKLRNDLILAEYLTRRVMASSTVVVAPTLTYHFYPAFLEYPGSTSLALATARDMTADAVRSLARYGPRRFYVLNTGISTLRPLEATAKMLATEGVLLHYTDLEARIEGQVRAVQQQPGGTHADEIETSMMLYIDPSSVDLTKAVRDYTPPAEGVFRLTRDPNGRGTYSRTGIWGDPTLATREKGRLIVEALVSGIVSDLDTLRKAPLPQAVSSPTLAPAHPSGGRGGRPSEPVQPNGCSAGDERSIRAIGPAFTLAWTNQDAERLARLWAFEGDIAHPDGSVERTSPVIRQNRAYLFSRPEYRASRHFLGIGNVRCLSNDVAVADGKWDLREVTDANRRAVPPIDGLCTLVVKRAGGGWQIEAYRYTITPRSGGAPSFLRQPGFIDK